MLCDVSADAKVSLDQFYEIIETDPEVFDRKGMTKDERIWFLSFASYLDIIQPSEVRKSAGETASSLAKCLDMIHFENIRSLYKRVFHPSYLGEIKRVLDQHGCTS